MPLSLRQAVAADAPVIAEYNRLLAEETEGKQLDPAELAAGVAACLAEPHKGIYFLAEDPPDVLGQLCITFEWSDWRNGWLWWIQSVYVRQDARRRGIFRALYDHVRRAAENDPEVIGLRLYMEQDNHAARQTYLRLGMKPTSYVVFEQFPL